MVVANNGLLSESKFSYCGDKWGSAVSQILTHLKDLILKYYFNNFLYFPFLQALNIQGRLKFLHGQNQRQENGGKAPPQLALFAIATPLQPPSILEIRTKNMIFRTKHKLDFTPTACDAK